MKKKLKKLSLKKDALRQLGALDEAKLLDEPLAGGRQSEPYYYTCFNEATCDGASTCY